MRPVKRMSHSATPMSSKRCQTGPCIPPRLRQPGTRFRDPSATPLLGLHGRRLVGDSALSFELLGRASLGARGLARRRSTVGE
jgi:hypothetical protein